MRPGSKRGPWNSITNKEFLCLCVCKGVNESMIYFGTSSLRISPCKLSEVVLI